jgi:hypothetical protein
MRHTVGEWPLFARCRRHGVRRERPLSPQRRKRADWVVFNAVGGASCGSVCYPACALSRLRTCLDDAAGDLVGRPLFEVEQRARLNLSQSANGNLTFHIEGVDSARLKEGSVSYIVLAVVSVVLIRLAIACVYSRRIYWND